MQTNMNTGNMRREFEGSAENTTQRRACVLTTVMLTLLVICTGGIAFRRRGNTDQKIPLTQRVEIQKKIVPVLGVVSDTNSIKYGLGFIEMGSEWRFGWHDGDHFSVCYCGSGPRKTAMIFRGDGTNHPGGGNRADFSLCDRSVSTTWSATGVRLTSNGMIMFGSEWCLGLAATGHLSLSHKKNHGHWIEYTTVMIWRFDGNQYEGPRTDYSCWTSSHTSVVRIGSESGRDFIQFGTEFRIGMTAPGHLSIGGDAVAVIYSSDGRDHKGPRFDFDWVRFPACQPTVRLQEDQPAPSGMKYGDAFIQLGDWRIGSFNQQNVYICYCGNPIETLRKFKQNGGRTNGGELCDTLCQLPAVDNKPGAIKIKRNGIEIWSTGIWCLGMAETGDLVLSSRKYGDPRVNKVWRPDGTTKQDERSTKYSCWNWDYPSTSPDGWPSVGQENGLPFLQFGNMFRMGPAPDGGHFIIGSDAVSEIYRLDDEIFTGPRFGFGWTRFPACAATVALGG